MDLQETGLDLFERDRRAILAMAGNFRTSFQFTETAGFTDEHDRFRLKSDYQDTQLYQLHFSHAEAIEQLETYDAREWGRRAGETIDLFLTFPSDT